MERGFDDSPLWDRWGELVAALEEGNTPVAASARADLIRAIDEPDTNFAQEAQFALEQHPDGLLEPLIAAAPGFGRFGSLCVIELFVALGSRRQSRF